MFFVDHFVLVAGVLLLLGIASSKFSARLGVPVLVLFLGVGMLAGSEGIGGIAFDDYHLAHGIGTVALAVILFDGGLHTPVSALRLAGKPALALATAGIVVTALVTGWAASRILGLPPLQGLLLGSIVGSTDAAAIFSVLRLSGLSVRRRLAATLEIESGSNDPMALLLTLGLLQVIGGEAELGVGLLRLFAVQMGVGALVGLGVGRGAVWLVDRVRLDAAGLYPVMVGACGLLSYGVAASLHGSGFLSAYLAGIVVGNGRIVFRRGVLLFHDAGAWLAQIVMFVVLGLLSFPSRLWEVAGPALLVALVLVLVARPLAVALTLLPFGFRPRELVFLSWAGLKGAVPITLATFPLLAGIPGAEFIFDVVFFVVLVSALTQGWTLPWLARKLGLEVPAPPDPPATLEITSLRHVDADIVEYTVRAGSPADGCTIRDLPFPPEVVVALVTRGERLLVPAGRTRIQAGDRLFVVLRPEAQPQVDHVFRREPPAGVASPLQHPPARADTNHREQGSDP